MKRKRYVWMKVSRDKYRLPEAVADSAVELGRMIGKSPDTIISAEFHARKRGYNSSYIKVEIDNDRDEDF